MNVTKIQVSKIIPDENQPRKYFDEAKMGTLKASIKTHGIKNPLILEVNKDGTYTIVDGERRYRNAKALGLKEVPAILEPARSPEQRLIEQFHVQEQHEGWTSVEKAVAVTKLSETMKSTIEEVGKLLGISEGNLRTYLAFGRIVDKKSFERSNVSMRNAGYINGLRDFVNNLAFKNDMVIDKGFGKKIENAIYTRINNGEEINTGFFTKIKDSLKQNPKLIEEFINNSDLTVEQLFHKSKAKGAMYLRKIEGNAGWLVAEIDFFMKDKSMKVDEKTLKLVKRAVEKGQAFVKAFED